MALANEGTHRILRRLRAHEVREVPLRPARKASTSSTRKPGATRATAPEKVARALGSVASIVGRTYHGLPRKTSLTCKYRETPPERRAARRRPASPLGKHQVRAVLRRNAWGAAGLGGTAGHRTWEVAA